MVRPHRVLCDMSAADCLVDIQARLGMTGRYGEMMLDGRAVGEISICNIDQDEIWISGFLILEGLQRQGLGRAILQQIVEACDAHSTQAYLEAFWRPDIDDGGHLVRFYTAHGFVAEDGPDEQGYVEMRRQPVPCPSLSLGSL